MRSLILVDFALYFVWKFPLFAPYLPPILARKAPYFALYFSVLALYWNVASMYILQISMIGIREYAWPQENVLIDIHEGYVAMDWKKVLQEQIITPKNAKIRHLKIYDYFSCLFFSLGQQLFITSIMCIMIFHSLSIFISLLPSKADSVYGPQCLSVCRLPTAADY
mgnify:CR=1 FL=1